MLSIIISTYKPNLLQQLTQNIAETIGDIDYEIIPIHNPGIMGICEAYNKGAIQAIYDNLLFIHEDVKLYSENWGQLLEKYYNLPNLGVLGLAGNKRKFHLPYGFHSGFPGEGFMYLNHTGHKKVIFEQPEFPLEVKVIDGVFIGIRKKVWEEFPFNEKELNGFHFYDIDISLRTSQKFKNYLVTDLDFEHFSEGNFGDQWIEACINFNRKKTYNYDPYTPKERRDVRNFWYDRLQREKISFFHRLRYFSAMGVNKDTLVSGLDFLFKRLEISPLVSVCIPTKNGAKFLNQALDSVLDQSYTNLEVIISDDASQDNTLEIAENFKKKAPFPVYIYQHQPQGIAANWNHSVEKAHGKYIKFLFQDDVLEKSCIERMMNFLQKNRLQIVFCKRTIINEDSQIIDSGDWFNQYGDLQKNAGLLIKNYTIFSKKNLKDLDFNRYSLDNLFGEPTACLFSKKLYLSVGEFNNSLKQILDYEYWLRALQKYKIGILEKKLVQFRLHGDQASYKNSESLNEEYKLPRKILYEKFLWNIEKKHLKYYLKNKYPFLSKLNALRYRN
ncbi:glycosyltransferase [Chryseobacterium camelliae]|uniref:Glycosyltransferase n=1 Tax=Chryseobacterium camelliae TaxID=1265445 RepID=A0ABY7QLK9_9FLAO|nr:glycosyltransferase [Chryseobacterium camelliae]WBV59573.1 glycosyltransferase [Chryseobacterium camelliae]